MSKRALKKYLSTLGKEQLEEQLLDLYERFKNVKTYYNFVFNPKEEKLVQECKAKIRNEYFPLKRRKPRMRRSVAQNCIKHFLTLGVEPLLIVDVMLYNLEVALEFTNEKKINQEAFYKSMLNSFEQAIKYIRYNKLEADFRIRIVYIANETEKQDWVNCYKFLDSLE